MKQETKLVPVWILIVSSLFALLGIAVSCSLYFSPQSVLTTVDINAKGFGYLIQMWAARQFSVGVIFGFATIRKSVPMLTISYVFFLVMNILDGFIGVFQNDISLTIGAAVMCVIAAAMLFALTKTTNE